MQDHIKPAIRNQSLMTKIYSQDPLKVHPPSRPYSSLQDCKTLCKVLLNPLILEPALNPQCIGRCTPHLQSIRGGCEMEVGSHPTLPSAIEGRMTAEPSSTVR